MHDRIENPSVATGQNSSDGLFSFFKGRIKAQVWIPNRVHRFPKAQQDYRSIWHSESFFGDLPRPEWRSETRNPHFIEGTPAGKRLESGSLPAVYSPLVSPAGSVESSEDTPSSHPYSEGRRQHRITTPPPYFHVPSACAPSSLNDMDSKE